MSETTREIRRKLEQTHAAIERKQRRNVFAGAGMLAFAWLTALILIEHQLYFSPGIKILLLIGLITVTVLSLYTGLSKLSSTRFIEFYRSFSRSTDIPELSYALDLESAGNANPKLVEAAIFANLKEIDPKVLDDSLNNYLNSADVTTRLRTRSRMLAGLALLTIITSFSLSSSTARIAQFWESFEKPNPYLFTVTPGDITLEQSSPFSVTATFDGELPEEVLLMLKTDVEENYRSRAMEAEGSSFTSIPIDLNNGISYYVEMDGYRSKEYTASVQLRPRFTELQVIARPPEYTGLDSTLFTYPFSQIQTYAGSEIEIMGSANKELSKLFMIRSADTLSLEPGPAHAFRYAFMAHKPDTLSFSLIDDNGLTNQNPFRFVIDPVSDDFPYVELIEPETSFEAIQPESVDLLFRATDDFQLTGAELKYELSRAFVENPVTGSIRLDRPVNGVLQPFSWEVTALRLKPKDRLTFWIEVTDNDGYNGFKSSRSRQITLSIPSLVDYFDDIDEQENDVQTDLEDVSESFEQMQDQYDEFKEQLKENPETNYEQQRQLQEVQRQQDEIQKKVEELNEKFEQIKEELSENDLLSEETLEAYNELKELMEQIDDPAFREALEKLQENMSQMTPEQLREALEETEFNEELYKERLERTLELFKQLKLNSDLEKLAQAYEDLARQEEEMSSSENESSRELDQRESVKEQIETLEKRLESLTDDIPENSKGAIQELQEYSEKELESVREQIEEMIEQLKQEAEGDQNASENGEESSDEPPAGDEGSEQGDQQQPARSPQSEQIQQQLQKLAQETRNAMQQMEQQQNNINVAGLQYILYSLLNLSVEQEDLVTYASTTENRSQAYVEYARDQKNVEDIFISLSDSLFELSKEIPQFENDINKKKLEVERRLTSSLEQMAERNQSRATVATRQALGGINEISFMIANLLEQIQNNSGSGSGSGSMSMQQMMEQMQQMGENQQQLNQQIQEMINDMQGERLTRDQMERLNQISRQQNQIRQQLQELQRRGALEGGDKLGSEIERMIEEMEETINDLRGGAVDPTLIERQQNILSRMLEAEQALQERDEEEKREGTTADPVNRTTPPELTLEELEKQIRNRLNDPNFTKYSTDYQRLIERYFELLKEIRNREIQ